MLRSLSLISLITLLLAVVDPVHSTCHVNELSTYATLPSGARTSANTLSSNVWKYDQDPPTGPYLDKCQTACLSSSTVLISMESYYNVFYIQINGRYLLSDYTWSAVIPTGGDAPTNVMLVNSKSKSTLNGAATFLVGYNNNAQLNSQIWNYFQPEYAFVFPYWNCPSSPGATANNVVTTGNYIPPNTVPGVSPTTWICGKNSWFVYSLTVKRYCPSFIRGDPAFVGLRGQDYQIHGIDGGLYNIISAPTYAINSRFVWLDGPRPCPVIPSTGKKSVACFQHKGSYLGNLAIMAGNKNKILIESGPAASGLTSVVVNDQPLTMGATVDLGNGQYINYNSTHEVSMKIGVFNIEVENSDHFVNLRHVSVKAADWSRLQGDDVHGLLGQTWSAASLKSKRVIEGIVDDYLIESNKPFDTVFMYDRFKLAQE